MATSIVISAVLLSAPVIVSVSSASSVPPPIETVEARVPASSSFIDPALPTYIAPERVFPSAMETGVVEAA